MTTPSRPALAEALAVLTDTHPQRWRKRVVLRMDGGAVWWSRDADIVGSCPWLHADPAEAQEALSQHGMLPDGWCGDVHRGWAQHRPECPWCGVGCHPLDPSKGVCVCDAACDLCNKPSREVGVNPCTIPDLVALASLGWPAIQRAEELAREACHTLREYGCQQPTRVVWRVGYRMLPGDFAWRLRGPYGVQRDGAASFPGGGVGPVRAVAELWRMGLALDAITADAVRIVVPPVGTDARPVLR